MDKLRRQEIGADQQYRYFRSQQGVLNFFLPFLPGLDVRIRLYLDPGTCQRDQHGLQSLQPFLVLTAIADKDLVTVYH